jgi:hypothetical protein
VRYRFSGVHRSVFETDPLAFSESAKQENQNA